MFHAMSIVRVIDMRLKLYIIGSKILKFNFLIACSFSSFFFLSACGLFSARPLPIDTYDLSLSKTPMSKKKTSKQVIVTQPTALKAFDSQNIVVKSNSFSIKYLSGAQWADRLPKILQARLLEALQKSMAFSGVGKPGEGISSDYEIVTEIRHFEVLIGSPNRAYVELFIKIVNDKNGIVLSSRSFEAQTSVFGNKKNSFVEGMDRAFEKIIPDVIDWASSIVS